MTTLMRFETLILVWIKFSSGETSLSHWAGIYFLEYGHFTIEDKKTMKLAFIYQTSIHIQVYNKYNIE